MTEIRQPTIDRALEAVDREREILATERDAFKTLLRRISTVQIETPTTASARGATGTTVAIATPVQHSSSSLRAVRAAYRETVMAVPHYESEYGESLRENLAVTCGPSLAGQLLDGEALTAPVYEAFVQACTQAREERQQVLGYVDAERDNLHRYETELTEIESAVVEAGTQITSTSGTRSLSRIDERLATLESRCGALARERQHRLHDRSETAFDRIDGLGVLEYLYVDMETSTPVLADVTACLRTIRNHRRRCLQ